MFVPVWHIITLGVIIVCIVIMWYIYMYLIILILSLLTLQTYQSVVELCHSYAGIFEFFVFLSEYQENVNLNVILISLTIIV